MADCSIQVIPSTFYAECHSCTRDAKDGDVPLRTRSLDTESGDSKPGVTGWIVSPKMHMLKP